MRNDEQSPIIIIQEICTVWGKDARGGAKAGVRNSTPEVLTIPAPILPDAKFSKPCLIHYLHYGRNPRLNSRNIDFQQPYQKIEYLEASEPVYYQSLSICPDNDAIKVMQLTPNTPLYQGRLLPNWQFTLSLGQWGVMSYYQRVKVGYVGEWGYEKCIFNVGFFKNPPQNVFVSTKPTHHYSSIKNLRYNGQFSQH